MTKKDNVARIDWWSIFLEGSSGEIIRHHPIIPFKHYRRIAEQIAWTEESKYRKGYYELANRNCEHFANMIVYGINYSEQIEERKEEVFSGKLVKNAFSPPPFLNPDDRTINNKSSSIRLDNEIKKSNNELVDLIDY